MKRFLHISIFLVIISLAFSALGYFILNKPKASIKPKKISSGTTIHSSPEGHVAKKLATRSAGIKSFCKVKGYNSEYCFMIDMGLHSGKSRFFIYDLNSNNVKDAGLVTHGSGSVGSGDQLVFSNKPGSNCTSLGKYRIGKDYYGRFGLAYKLHGLDQSNSKAFERFVVLHAHACVPGFEVYPLSICPSLGCPTVSPAFLQKLKSYVDQSAKPILLYIYK
jgi:hypothetical protein